MDPSQDIQKRLQDNHKLIMEVERLQKRNRQRMQGALVNNPQLADTYTQLMSFFRRGEMNLLESLNYGNIEQLLQASKCEAPKRLQPVVTPSDLEDGEPKDVPSPADEGPLRGKALRETIADYLIEGQENELQELADVLRQQLENPQEGASVPTLGGRDVEYIKLNSDLHTNLRAVCHHDSWGGLLKTTRSDLREALQYARLDLEFEPYNPQVSPSGSPNVEKYIRRFDELLQITTFTDALKRLSDSRERLSRETDLLLIDPLLLFGAYPQVRKALFDYIKSYTDLLAAFSAYQDKLMNQANEAFRFVATQVLRWDTLYVKVQSEPDDEPEWRALLTPLHPLHLWKFREILQPFFEQQDHTTFDQAEIEQLRRTLPALPHLLHYLPLDPKWLSR